MNAADHAFSYIPRVVDNQIAAKLSVMPTVLIEGPRGCGKTTTARQFANREYLLDTDLDAREHAVHGTLPLGEGPHPLLLDEWSAAPPLWNRVRRASDDGPGPGQFILTASANPVDDITRHSGAGRVSRIRMRPMSLQESGASDGTISLAELFAGKTVSTRLRSTPSREGDIELRHIVDWLCRGGWPACRGMTPVEAQIFLDDYLGEIARVDMPRAVTVDHNPENIRRLLVSLARHSASPVPVKTLAEDVGRAKAVSHETLVAYLDALTRIFAAEDQPAWSTHLKSKSTLRKTPKRHLVDPALAVAALRSNPDRLFADRKALGCLFESMAVRDLRVYAQANDASVHHYRDNTGLEADAILERRDGAWMAVEVKLGGSGAVEEAAASLVKLRDRVDTAVIGEPARLLVLTATGGCWERADGVTVAPLSMLGC